MSTVTKPLALHADDAAHEDQHQYLTFRLGDETFAIGILAVKEILEYGLVTAVPMMPSFVRGVINLRGRVVPVVDLSLRFGGTRSESTRRTCIIILEVGPEAERQDVGVVVDAVSQVLEISPADVEPAPAFGAKLRADFIAGMGKIEGDFVIILNVERILSTEELAATVSLAR
ncbi:MAG TPA: chemotaxis protein CheW [Gammaproteobacteria bacterium]|nr:chemotaxis protein CheW [Gammaproteobacteria bacterium]